MIINHNLNAMNAHRNMGFNTTNTGKAMEKLSSGLRINRAGDDAAGLAISEKMRGQIRGLDQATRNSQDAISLIQTAEGGLNETHSILQRMRELATQAANDTNVGTDRTEIQKEINQLTSEINRIGNTTEFNTQKLLNGSKFGTGTAATAGVYTATIGTAFAAGEELNIDGVVFKAKAAGTADYSKNEFEVGANLTDQATNLAKAFQNNAALSDKYSVTHAAGVLTFTQKEGYASATPLVASDSATTGAIAAAEVTAGVNGTSGKLTMQVGANGGQSLSVEISDMRADASTSGMKVAGSASGTVVTTSGKTAVFTSSNTVTDGTTDTSSMAALDVSTSSNASAAIDAVDDSIKAVSAERSKLGAIQNRLEHTINNLSTSAENLQAAESRIRDVDMAKEMMNFTKNNILNQAAQAMLSQANQQPQAVLQLLR